MRHAKQVDQRLEQYLLEALHILELNLRLAYVEEPACYRVVAAQLRLLLCDTTRQHGKIVDISLVARVFPDLHLLPLQLTGRLPQDFPAVQLTLQQWLAQEMTLPGGENFSLRSIIRLACDHDGGAHVDLPPDSLPDVRSAILLIAEAALPGLRAALPENLD